MLKNFEYDMSNFHFFLLLRCFDIFAKENV